MNNKIHRRDAENTKEEYIEVPFKLSISWVCPRCKRFRRVVFKEIPRTYNIYTESKLGSCFHCGCPAPNLMEDKLHFYLPNGLITGNKLKSV